MTNIALIIVRKNDRYLLTQKHIDNSDGGCWSVPSGKNDVDEESIIPFANEILYKETGLLGNDLELLSSITLNQDRINVLLSQHWSGAMNFVSKTIMGAGWFTIPEIWKLDQSLSPQFAKLLPQITFLIRHDHKYLDPSVGDDMNA